MKIFSRLLKIISSRLPYSGKNQKLGDTPEVQKYFKYKKVAADHGETEAQQNQTVQNPELAAYYANLDLPYGSHLESVKHAWKRLVSRYHPDLHSSNPNKRRVANELTQGLNRAYEELTRRLENGNSKHKET